MTGFVIPVASKAFNPLWTFLFDLHASEYSRLACSIALLANWVAISILYGLLPVAFVNPSLKLLNR